jgi:hypothetical protein
MKGWNLFIAGLKQEKIQFLYMPGICLKFISVLVRIDSSEEIIREWKAHLRMMFQARVITSVELDKLITRTD